MFINKWKPLYGPDDDLAAPEPEIQDQGTPAPAEQPDGPGSGRGALRKQLEKGFDDDRKATEKAEKAAKATRGKARVAGGATIEPDAEEEAAPEADEAAPEGEEAAKAAPAEAPPEAFSKEAKAEWAKVPPTVRAAILKRETDVAKGVEELKGRYKDIDTALAPHIQAIRQHGHTPAQAVNQLFSWFQALGANPDVAFPALAKSFGYDLAKAAAPAAAAPGVAAAAPADGTQPAGEIPPAVQSYINTIKSELDQVKQAFSQELSGLKGTFQQQSEAKTQEILTNWSKGKPHFEEVRGLMAQLIASGAVPLKEGQVDLDGAYDMALYASPEVRAKVLADQEAARVADAKKKAADAKKKAEEDAAKARRAGVSLGTGAPGEGAAPTGGKRGKGKTVRESIMEAREELTS